MSASVTVVVPTLGRTSLSVLLAALRLGDGAEILVVDDRADRREPLAAPGAKVLTGRAAGPAAARNAGWRASDADWIAFLDDDVLPPRDWGRRLLADLARLDRRTAGCMGRVRVPLPAGRPPTDWERNVARLADTPGIVTADFVVRRAALEAVGGFDERFPRAYREDTDLELRLQRAGWRVERGGRDIEHPIRAASPLVSLGLQRGNADDVLFWALHGGREHVAFRTKGRYAAVTALALLAVTGRRWAGAAWLAETARFAWSRASDGPRTPGELAGLALTSAALPPLALGHTARGLVRHRDAVTARLR
jgi:glycosyltransferase involved in cell wall biosynthesis